jgi:hypothetical protein
MFLHKGCKSRATIFFINDIGRKELITDSQDQIKIKNPNNKPIANIKLKEAMNAIDASYQID